jgi:DNA-binding response OmpR family regulator
MDRVLLLIDDIQYAGHLETTLRKVGFDPETITNEYNLPDKLLAFNPDYIIAKGNSARVSSLSIGKKLKENQKFLGKVILIFTEATKPSPEELILLRMDLLLFEPMSALRLVADLLTLTQMDRETIMDKLLRFAHTDNQFRTNEQQILKSMGATIDSEIQIITGSHKVDRAENPMDENTFLNFGSFEEVPAVSEKKKPSTSAKANLEDEEEDDEPIAPVITNAYKDKLKNELEAAGRALPIRIEAYNQVIKEVDQDLRKGLKKRQTKVINKKIFEGSSAEDLKTQDEERKNFVKALLKK